MITYVNGDYVPDHEARISVFDRGLTYGDAVFDTPRTFDGQVFKLDEHLARLSRSLRYTEFDADPIIDEVREAVMEVVSRSLPEIKPAGDAWARDVWVMPVVTRGPVAEADFLDQDGPTVIVLLRKFSFAYGPLYREGGVELEVSLLNRHFSGPVDPRVKAVNRLGAVLGDLKAARATKASGRRRSASIVFSDDGSIAESEGANLGIVVGGKFVRPPRHEALEGISIETVCELVRDLGMDVEERKLTAYDIINADETFITATSYGVLPVVGIDGIPLRAAREVYPQILQAWIDLVQFDFVSQACECAEEEAEKAAGGAA